MTYVASAFNNPSRLLLPGQPGYSFGSFDDHLAATKMTVTRSAESAGNNITITVKIIEGPIPVAGQLISTQALFNVANKANVAIASTTGFSSGDNSSGTITYADALAAGLIAAAPDSGLAIVPPTESAEALAAGVAGQQWALGAFDGQSINERTVAWETEFPSAPGSVTMLLEAAMRDVDAEYHTLDTSSSASGELRYVVGVKENFLRVKCSAEAGGSSPTVIAKILI